MQMSIIKMLRTVWSACIKNKSVFIFPYLLDKYVDLNTFKFECNTVSIFSKLAFE